MSAYSKSLSLAAAVAVLAVVAIGQANAANQSEQVAAISPPAAVTLPEVTVHPQPSQGWYYDPYTSGRAVKSSSLNHIPFSHFKVPVGYDSNMMMHPYTTGMGPCTEGASPAQGCHHDTGHPISTSHYERPPFNQ